MVIIENYCLLCNQPLAIAAHGICGFCERGLPEMPPVCRRCGLPLVTLEPACGHCLQSPPPWQSLLAVTGYQPPLAALVHRLKYSGQTHIARALARPGAGSLPRGGVSEAGSDAQCAALPLPPVAARI